MQFICMYHPHDNVPPLSNRLPGKKKKEVRRWDPKRGWSSVGRRRAESSPDRGNTSEILWNHRKGKRREQRSDPGVFAHQTHAKVGISPNQFQAAIPGHRSQGMGFDKAWCCVRGAERLGMCPSLALKGDAVRQGKAPSAQGAKNRKESKQGREMEKMKQKSSLALAFWPHKSLLAEEKSDGTKHK